MDLGRCRTCGRSIRPGEVAGLGILRPRPATAGGPVVELECPGCKTLLTFIPHGNGRYAFPGQPPPPPPAARDRVAPWQRAPAAGGSPAGKEGGADSPPPPPPPPTSPPGSRPPTQARPSGGAARTARGAPNGPRGPSTGGPSRPAGGPLPPGAPGATLPEPAVRSAAEAREVLGTSPDADREVIEAAYRERALTCHPDKVAHLDGDFVRLAEWKFRRLQAARDLLLAGRADGARPDR